MDDHKITWSLPPSNWRFEADSPHVWGVSLRVSLETLNRLDATLSPDEHARADRFHFEVDRRRFIAGRGLLRRILASYLDAQPGEIEFNYGAHGKPALGGRFAESGLLFNLAHCESLALVAVARDATIGVDVERVRSLPDADHLASRFFSPGERNRYHNFPTQQRAHVFFNIWTRKEAWLKALGEGIACSLNEVDPPPRWKLHDLAPAEGFAGALATALADSPPVCWRWSKDHE
jgi:4'-phosphopantetheinyl transferase